MLNERQKRFCEEYVKHLNASKAARDVGYSHDTAYSIGWENLRKPDIKSYISELLEQQVMTATETKKSISDIAKASLNEYFTIKQIVRKPRIEVHLSHIIQQKKEQIEDIGKLLQRVSMSDEQLEGYNNQIARLRFEIVEIEIALERNPLATDIIDGPPELVEVADLDMAKLIKDKEAGRIKSFSIGEFGPKIELYAADGALANMARIHGLFEKDNEQSKGSVQIVIDGHDARLGDV